MSWPPLPSTRPIAERTRNALAAAQARGVVLGGYRGKGAPDATAREKAAIKLAKIADERSAHTSSRRGTQGVGLRDTSKAR